MRRLKAMSALIVGLAALAGVPAVAHGAVPRDFFGLVSDDAFAQPGGYRATQFANQHAVGFRLLRQTFNWSQIETSPGTYDFSFYDQYVGDAAQAGLSVLPILFRAPAFDGGGSGTIAQPPKKNSDMGNFGAAVARRYGTKGSFWTDNPGIPKLPITAFQIWNEPNLKAYWARRPNAKQYVQMLRTVGKAIKKADRGAEIVTAGMPQSKIGVSLTKWIPAMYKAGAKGTFDTMAINPYGRSAKAVVSNISRVRSIMRKAHDHSPIWGTELGWSDTGPSSPQRVGAAGQATQLTKLVPLLLKKRRSLKIRGMVYFGWRDAPVYPGGKDFWGLHTGLLTLDGTPKPAYGAAQAALAKVSG